MLDSSSARHANGARIALLALMSLFAAIAGAEPAVEIDGADDAAVGAKLQASIQCINGHSQWVLKSRERYLSWIRSPQAGPTGKEPVIYGLYTLHDISRCRDGLQQSIAQPPSLPAFEQAATDWLAALQAAESVIAEANTYYELENYKDDGMQLGKTLHPRLLDVWAAFDSADDALRVVLDSTKDRLDERRLQRLENDPAQRSAYLGQRILRDAKQLLRSARGLGGNGFDAATFATSVAALEQDWQALVEHRKASAGSRDDIVRSSSFVDATFALLKSAKAAERRARDGFRLDESEQMLADNNAAQLVDGHPVQLLEKYNGLIDVANRTRW